MRLSFNVNDSAICSSEAFARITFAPQVICVINICNKLCSEINIVLTECKEFSLVNRFSCENVNILYFLPARRYASVGYSDRNVSVRLSVRPSVTRRYCVKTKKASGMISSPSDSPKTLVF